MIKKALTKLSPASIFCNVCAIYLSMTSIEAKAADYYYHDAGFIYEISGGECGVVGFVDSDVSIPESIGSCPVVSVSNGDRKVSVWEGGGRYKDYQLNSSILRSVEIPSSVKCISLNGQNLASFVVESGPNQLSVYLSDCPSLTSVPLPDNVESLDLSNCDGLSSIGVYPSCLKWLTISGCDNLVSVSVPEGVWYVHVSGECLTELVLPKGLKGLELSGSNITSLELPEGMSSLSMRNCTSLKSLSFYDLPNEKLNLTGDECPNLETIVQHVGSKFPRLYRLQNLKSVTIGEGVGQIGGFEGLESLEQVFVPSTVSNIEIWCFQDCPSLRSIDLSHAKCEILTGTFEGSAIEHVVLPSCLKTIGWHTFAGCSNLRNVEIPDAVEEISKEAFSYCVGLEKIVLKNVNEIGEAAFEGCTGLESVEILGSIQTLGPWCFRRCVNLHNVHIEGVGFNYDTQRPAPFFDCSNIVSVVISPKDAFGYPGVMPHSDAKIQDLEVVEGVTNVTLVCGPGLKRLVLPATMETFSAPVYNNPNLGEIIVNAENPRFVAKDGILYDKGMTTVIACGCAKTKVELPDTVKAIGKNAFRNCIRIEDVKFPMSVGDIGGSSFYGCTNLASMTLSACLTNIAASAFYKCTRLQDVEFPCALENIGDNAFAYCNNLSEVKLHDGLLVGRGAFSYCSGLRNAIVGKVKVSDVRTGQGLFGQCANLTDVVIDEDASWLGWSSAFSGCKKLQQVKLPRAWKVIPSQVFYGCEALSDLETGNGIESIDNYAFYNCSSLRSVRIPAATTNVGNYAFNGVTMKEVVFEGDLPVLQSKCYLIDNAAKVYYPRQFAEHYLPVVPAEKFGGYTEDNQFVKSGEGRLMAIPTSWVNEVFDAHPELKEAWSGNVGGFVRQPTGKSYGGEGGAFVWHDYVAGTDPTDPEDVFTATIEFEDGMPKIKYAPELTEHQKALRKYVVYGKKNLADAAWSIVSDGRESEYSFFKVGVDLK